MTPSESHTERILRHIGRYSLTIRPVLDKLFFRGVSGKSHNLIQAMLRDELLTYHSLGKVSYYQLTKKGALKVGLPSTRAHAVGEHLTEHLAYLWFCTLGRHQRELLDRQRLRGYFPNTNLRAAHCLQARKGARTFSVFRLRLAGTNASDSSLLKSLQGYIAQATEPSSELNPLLRRRLYGFAILFHSHERRRRFKAAAEAKRLFTLGARSRRVNVLHQFEIVPAPETLERAIHALYKQDT